MWTNPLISIYHRGTYANSCLLYHSLAQAKTGTGKTLAFLIPILQAMLKDPRLDSKNRSVNRPTPGDVRAIIVSPTRELAEQIAMEAQKVVANTGIVVQTAVGGTRKREGLMKIQKQGCHLLVGTPGRLIDILSDPYSGVKAPNLSAFVLDEADRLLDIGFAPDIARMQEYLPSRSEVDRQTLLFSATVPRTVMDVVSRTMKPDFSFVKTVQEDETPTHLKVPQKIVFLNGLENQLAALLDLSKKSLAAHKEDPENNLPFKAIVYFNSTAEVTLAHSIFRGLGDGRSRMNMLGIPLTEMHSRLTQGQRTYNSNSFRRMDSGILFSSDVTARGMDFPNVSHVVQVGIPRDRESYIHRLGRTARANKKGEGWLFVTDLEYQSFQRKLHDLPLERDNTSLPSAHVDMSQELGHSPEITTTLSQLADAARAAPEDLKRGAFLGSINFALSVRDPKQGYEMISNLATHGWGMDELPNVPPRLATELGRALSKGPRSGGSRFGGSSRGSGGFSRGSGGFSRGSGGFSRGSDRSGGFSRGSDRESGGFSRGGGGFSRGSDRSGGFSRGSDRGSGGFSRGSGGFSRGSDRGSGGFSRGGHGSGGFSRGGDRSSRPGREEWN